MCLGDGVASPSKIWCFFDIELSRRAGFFSVFLVSFLEDRPACGQFIRVPPVRYSFLQGNYIAGWRWHVTYTWKVVVLDGVKA